MRNESADYLSLTAPWDLAAVFTFCGVINLTGFFLTALGTILTFKGNRAMKRAKVIEASARQNVMLQVAVNEMGSLANQTTILKLRIDSKNWDLGRYISAELTSRLREAKGAFSDVKGVNRDRLEVAARSAAALNEYLSNSPDPEDELVKESNAECAYLDTLLRDILGSLKLRPHVETIL